MINEFISQPACTSDEALQNEREKMIETACISFVVTASSNKLTATSFAQISVPAGKQQNRFEC